METLSITIKEYWVDCIPQFQTEIAFRERWAEAFDNYDHLLDRVRIPPSEQMVALLYKENGESDEDCINRFAREKLNQQLIEKGYLSE